MIQEHISAPPMPTYRQVSEHTAASWDGTQLFYRAWLPEQPAKQAVILFHRGHEHSGRWQETVDQLDLPGVALFAWDARGHGRSPGERGAAPNLAAMIKDVDCFMRHLSEAHDIPISDMVVVAHSVGAVIASAWVHDYAPPIRGMVLAAPAFRVKLYVPMAMPLLRLKQTLLGPGFVKSYVKARMLTRDAEQARQYDADELIFRQIAVNVLLDLHDVSARLLADAGAITTPTLVLAAGADWVVDVAAQRKFFERISSSTKRMEVLPDFQHAMFHERDRDVLIKKVRDFVLEQFDQPPTGQDWLRADRYGYTYDEFSRLRRPGPWRFNLIRRAMQTLGRMSRGVDLGWRSGFDSGVTLDYVYENRPAGRTALGRMMDRAYLQSIGWRGIRQRRVHLEALLRKTMEQTQAAGRPVRVVDIACGAGRYVLDTMHALPHIPSSAALRDYKQQNLDAACRRAAELGLPDVTISHGDAFDQESLASLLPRPTIGIVSGLYELFPENEPVMRSLRGLAEAIEPGGYLIYTNQPWHPQVEFIARVLTNREGQPWIMRRRTQAEMDALVQAAGFEKIEQEIDEWGIFTVSVARRLPK